MGLFWYFCHKIKAYTFQNRIKAYTFQNSANFGKIDCPEEADPVVVQSIARSLDLARSREI